MSDYQFAICLVPRYSSHKFHCILAQDSQKWVQLCSQEVRTHWLYYAAVLKIFAGYTQIMLKIYSSVSMFLELPDCCRITHCSVRVYWSCVVWLACKLLYGFPVTSTESMTATCAAVIGLPNLIDMYDGSQVPLFLLMQ